MQSCPALQDQSKGHTKPALLKHWLEWTIWSLQENVKKLKIL